MYWTAFQLLEETCEKTVVDTEGVFFICFRNLTDSDKSRWREDARSAESVRSQVSALSKIVESYGASLYSGGIERHVELFFPAWQLICSVDLIEKCVNIKPRATSGSRKNDRYAVSRNWSFFEVKAPQMNCDRAFQFCVDEHGKPFARSIWSAPLQHLLGVTPEGWNCARFVSRCLGFAGLVVESPDWNHDTQSPASIRRAIQEKRIVGASEHSVEIPSLLSS